MEALTGKKKNGLLFFSKLLCALLCGLGIWFVFGGESRLTLPFVLALTPALFYFLEKTVQECQCKQPKKGQGAVIFIQSHHGF